MNEIFCHNPCDKALLYSGWVTRKGGLIIGFTPFQRALIQVALERYQAELNQDLREEEYHEIRLWIDRAAKQISLSEIPGAISVIFSSLEQRDAVIGSLINRGYTFISQP